MVRIINNGSSLQRILMIFFHDWEIVKSRQVIFLKENVLFKPNCWTVELQLVCESQLVLNRTFEYVVKIGFSGLKRV